MGNLAAHHEVTLAVRLTGGHDALAAIAGTMIQVLIPGAAITLADPHAARAMLRAWIEANIIGRKVFTDQGARSYGTPNPQIIAAATIREQAREASVTGKMPRRSPSGCGQVIVQLGRLVIVCDDRAALQDQCRVWRDAYRLATDLWDMNPLDMYEHKAESEIAERLFQEGHR